MKHKLRSNNNDPIYIYDLNAVNKELLEALKELVITIAPDYSIDQQESYFHKPLLKALEAIAKAEQANTQSKKG